MNALDYDRLAAEYSAHRQVHPGVLQRLHAQVRTGHTFLEVGCGTGNYIATLAALTGCQGWGIDPSAKMLAQAQNNLDRRALTSVHLSQGQAERLDFPDAQFDLVFSVDVIHHVQDRKAYLAQAYRTLRPRGRLCTVTDTEWIIRHREPLAVYWPETIEVELARYPRLHDLEAMYQEAGFSSLETQQVEHHTTLTDVQPYRDKAFSSLHLISESAFRRGMARLEQDLSRGPVAWVSRYVLLCGTKP